MAIANRAGEGCTKGGNNRLHAGNESSQGSEIAFAKIETTVVESQMIWSGHRKEQNISDPSLPLGLISPFDPKFPKFKERAKTQEEWDELRIVQGRDLHHGSQGTDLKEGISSSRGSRI